MTRPLNIIHLHSHDTGRYVQPYGTNTPTPCLQAFAEQGVVFRQAFSAASTCSPSRASLLTGQHPHNCGMFGLATANAYFELDDYSRHLAHFLRSHGYETAVAGVNHETRGYDKPIEGLGYDHWLNHEPDGMPLNHLTVGKAVDFINRPHDRPFFLSCGIQEPHREKQSQGRRHGADADLRYVEQLDGRFTRPPAVIPDTPMTRQDWASFCHGVQRMDRKMGAVIDAVDAAGLADSTIIIATTDHGIAWPHAKMNLTDMGLGVMLMIRGPQQTGFTGGRVVDALVSQIDLFPTLCELLDIETPPWLAGQSIMPVMDGRSEAIRECVFGEQNYHGWIFDPQRTVRTVRYRYIRRKPVDHVRVVDLGPTNQWFREMSYGKWPEGEELLFDLYFDPMEMCNLADSPEHVDVLAELRGRLDHWMQQTNDPFLADSIPQPADRKQARLDVEAMQSSS